jgi:hypothetical protein
MQNDQKQILSKMPNFNSHYTTVTYFTPVLDNDTQTWFLFVFQI